MSTHYETETREANNIELDQVINEYKTHRSVWAATNNSRTSWHVCYVADTSWSPPELLAPYPRLSCHLPGNPFVQVIVTWPFVDESPLSYSMVTDIRIRTPVTQSQRNIRRRQRIRIQTSRHMAHTSVTKSDQRFSELILSLTNKPLAV